MSSQPLIDGSQSQSQSGFSRTTWFCSAALSAIPPMSKKTSDTLVGLCAGRAAKIQVKHREALSIFRADSIAPVLPAIDEKDPDWAAAVGGSIVEERPPRISSRKPWKTDNFGITFRARYASEDLRAKNTTSSHRISPSKSTISTHSVIKSSSTRNSSGFNSIEDGQVSDISGFCEFNDNRASELFPITSGLMLAIYPKEIAEKDLASIRLHSRGLNTPRSVALHSPTTSERSFPHDCQKSGLSALFSSTAANSFKDNDELTRADIETSRNCRPAANNQKSRVQWAALPPKTSQPRQHAKEARLAHHPQSRKTTSSKVDISQVDSIHHDQDTQSPSHISREPLYRTKYRDFNQDELHAEELKIHSWAKNHAAKWKRNCDEREARKPEGPENYKEGLERKIPIELMPHRWIPSHRNPLAPEAPGTPAQHIAQNETRQMRTRVDKWVENHLNINQRETKPGKSEFNRAHREVMKREDKRKQQVLIEERQRVIERQQMQHSGGQRPRIQLRRAKSAASIRNRVVRTMDETSTRARRSTSTGLTTRPSHVRFRNSQGTALSNRQQIRNDSSGISAALIAKGRTEADKMAVLTIIPEAEERDTTNENLAGRFTKQMKGKMIDQAGVTTDSIEDDGGNASPSFRTRYKMAVQAGSAVESDSDFEDESDEQ